jgi:esterase/lipase superfamily enzyme/TRAP-type C4-dicarboxylate transport system substrate-binding protein
MHAHVRAIVLTAVLTSCVANCATAEEAWSVYVVNPTVPVQDAVKSVVKHWDVVPGGAQPIVASVDTATFCSHLKESATSLYVASATDYKHCYPDVPIFGAFDFPYPTRDWRSKIGIADGPVGAAYAQGAAAIGVRVMAYWSGDQNVIVSGAPIKGLEDFKGMKLYVPENFSSQIFASSTGGKAVQSTEGDRFKLLSSPSKSAATQISLDRYTSSIDQLHKNVLISDTSFDPVVVAAPEKAWESLSAVKQGQLEGVMREVTEAERRDALKLASINIKILKKSGKSVSELPKADLLTSVRKEFLQATSGEATTVFGSASEEVKQASLAQATGQDQSPYAHVLFVTNRDPANRFSSPTMAKNLSYGEADVELAYASPNPVVEDANRIIRFLPGGGDAVKIDWAKVSGTPFDDKLLTVPHNAPSKAPLIFVHGFANDFDDALRGAAWIAWNSRRPVIVFSWPSNGRVSINAYRDDQRIADSTEEMLAQFLNQLGKGIDGQTDVDIVVHSMGARLLLGALDKLAANGTPLEKPKFRQLLLVAPDVTQAQLHQDWPKLETYFEQVGTLYSSDHDRALIISKAFLNAGSQPRAGLSPPYEVEQNMDSVFVGDDEFSATGHSYLTTNGPPATDIMELLRYATKATDRSDCEAAPDGAGYYVLRSVDIP